MGLEKGHRPVGPRFARDLADIDPGFPQGMAGLAFLSGVVIQKDIVGDPAVQEILRILAGHETADLVSHDRLQVMGEPGNRENILELGGQPGIGVGRIGVVNLGLVGASGC